MGLIDLQGNTKPVEVILTKKNIELVADVYFEDESSDGWGDVVSLSMRGAQREITAHMISVGYEPVGRWEVLDTGTNGDGETARKFRKTKAETIVTVEQLLKTDEVEESEASHPKDYAGKEITPTAQALAEWITEQTGYEADERSVYLTMALRRRSRLDPATRDRIAEIRDERKAAARAAAPASV